MFMDKLESNLRQAVKGTGVERVRSGHMMTRLTMSEDADWGEVHERVMNTFGVAKFFPAYKVKHNYDAVERLVEAELQGRSFDTFRITAHRTDKRFKMTSDQINRKLGDFVRILSGAKVNLKEHDLEIFVDVLPYEILVYFDEIKGYGGMPVGVSGETMTLLSGGIDSPVAAWHMMKRGSRTSFVHFHSYPLVDTSSIEKANELAQLLTRFQYNSTLFLVPFGGIQQQIILSVPPSYRVVMYRRFMVRIAEALARKHGALALVTGESLGQVAFQTLENISVIDEVSQLPVLRPLIGLNKEEIIQVSRKIGTFPVSILPDQDCCSLFVPKHPVTRSNSDNVRRLESALPVQELVDKAVEEVSMKQFAFPGSD
jgi:thiamine biosynthesis protein ThiI